FGLLLVDADAAGDRAERAVPEEPAECAAEIASAAIGVLRDDVRNDEIIGGLHLAAADVGAALQLAIIGQRALDIAALQALVAVDQAEAARFHHEQFDDRLGA